MKLKKKTIYPSKTTLNLVIKERSANHSQKLVAGLLIIFIVLATFCKFAVIDPLSAAKKAESDASKLQSQLEVMLVNNSGYQVLKDEYERYFAINPFDGKIVNSMELIGLIEAKIMSAAKVESISFEKDTLSVVMRDIDLDQASVIYESLYQSELVSSVALYAAATIEDEISSIAITIVFKTEGDEPDAE